MCVCVYYILPIEKESRASASAATRDTVEASKRPSFLNNSCRANKSKIVLKRNILCFGLTQVAFSIYVNTYPNGYMSKR